MEPYLLIEETCVLGVGFLTLAGISWGGLNLYVRHLRETKVYEEGLSPYELAQRKSFLFQVKPLLQNVVLFNKRFEIGRRWMEESHYKWDALLLRAGSPGKLTSEEFLALKQIAPPHFLLALLIFKFYFPALLLILMLFSYYLPNMWLNDRVRLRNASIVRSLPDALDTFSLMVQAGLDFGQALDTYIRTAEPGPLVSEFSLARNEMRLGMSRAESLSSMSERTNCPPLANFTTAVIQAEKTGTSVADVLNSQAYELRTKRFQMAEEMGQKATIKMLLPLLLLILPNVFIVLFAPMGIKFFLGE